MLDTMEVSMKKLKLGGLAKDWRSVEFKSPEQYLPVLESLLSENTQADTRTQYCQQTLKIQGSRNLWSLVLSEES